MIERSYDECLMIYRMSYVWYLMPSILHLLMCLCFVMLMYFRDLIFEFNVSRDRILSQLHRVIFSHEFLSLFLFLFILTFEKPPHLPADSLERNDLLTSVRHSAFEHLLCTN